MDNITSDVAKAARVLRAGGVVAFPTETVYGLGALAHNADAVRRVFRMKRRPFDHPLIVHASGWSVPQLTETTSVVDFHSETLRQPGEALGTPDTGGTPAARGVRVIMERNARLLAERAWPGPLTLILSLVLAGDDIPPEVTGGQPSVGLRIPSHPLARALIEATGGLIAAPSANRFGRLSPTRPEHVLAEFPLAESGEHAADAPDLVLDGGPSVHGLESTIIDFRDDKRPRCLRLGPLDGEVTGLPDLHENFPNPSLRVSGNLPSHYAPGLPILPDQAERTDGVAFLGFGGTPDSDLDLSPLGSVEEAAKNFYHYLRLLDDPTRFSAIAIVPFPPDGVGLALQDRIVRAAHRKL